MKLLILCFSGTGNTDYVTHYLASSLAHLPVEIEIGSIKCKGADRLNRFDLLALGFPVYARDAPRLLHEYIDAMPPGAGRGVFVFCTKGVIAGNAVGNTLAGLEIQGYVSLGGETVAMPNCLSVFFMLLASANYVLYRIGPLAIFPAHRFPWSWWVSVLIATIIALPSGWLWFRGMRDAGEETMIIKKEHTLYLSSGFPYLF